MKKVPSVSAMGALISRWKTKRTKVEELENLEKEINKLEEFRTKNQRLQKLWVGRLLFYSSVLYLFTSFIVYCLYLPDEWLKRLAMALPFFAYPVLVWFIRKLLLFLFSKLTERNNDKLEDLKAAKKKILEEVMETETYKSAKLILERFDPESKNKHELESTPVGPQLTARQDQEIRQRAVGLKPMSTCFSGPKEIMLTPAAQPESGRVDLVPLSGPGGPPEKSTPNTSILQGTVQRTPSTPNRGVGMYSPGPPLARPILPRERGTVDRFIEFLVGDGPQNRYALICQQCFSHNGMALKEEFEYLAFRCAYCYFLNPARKTRPQAPRLPEFSFERRLRADLLPPRRLICSETDAEESTPPCGDEKDAGEDERGSEEEKENQLEEKRQTEEEEDDEVVVEEEKESEQSEKTTCTGERPPLQ